MDVHALYHQPVLAAEVIASLRPESANVAVDCTFGRGGHSRAMLAEMGPDARLVALDRDPDAIREAQAWARRDARVDPVHAPFSQVDRALASRGLVGAVDAIVFDLGVSSPQLDTPERGFSFRHDGPLDMRMDPSAGPSAAQWLATVDEDELARVLRTFGEERLARRIARAIVRRRSERAIAGTRDLAELVSAQYPRRRGERIQIGRAHV